MSNPPDRPWTEEEKYFLLSEILKKAGIPSSYLVRMVNDFRIIPNWGDIPLPPGRSLNACKLAFFHMQHQPAHPSAPPAPAPTVAPAAAPATAPTAATAALIARPEMPGTPAPIDPTLRKRPLYPADKPIAPRAIQPRPPASTASYSSESGASAQLSPRQDSMAAGANEPPRKRGRPSKAETERRRAAAQARGETYPPPRRMGSGRLKIPPSPTSPMGNLPMAPYPPAGAPQPAQGPSPGPIHYDAPASRPIAPAPGFPGSDERREMPTRSMSSNLRELPRPAEMNHPLPSPHTLNLGPPDSFPRLNSSERGSYGTIPPDRFSPDSGRRDSVTSRIEPPPGPYSEGRSSTTPGDRPAR
ncbi:uncharacterized protein N7459_003842 [Penicillium hispanicum]|uniref:uncharacterized protein n=1 Tax=Penicillium hispanicum TaxID=1080232 RepID=UPI002541A0F3|nr:uncharacterized protein N7459_003842 [Penicillium hispanicum]KAJ5584042.1 hypothetical protein N7459_003842 [Penicillium hispanicum]